MGAYRGRAPNFLGVIKHLFRGGPREYQGAKRNILASEGIAIAEVVCAKQGLTGGNKHAEEINRNQNRHKFLHLKSLTSREVQAQSSFRQDNSAASGRLLTKPRLKFRCQRADLHKSYLRV